MEMENHLREKRQALALSQKQLADLAGITRQAVSALESNQYSPATSVALQLARALDCRVEDLFSIKQGGEIIEGELLGTLPSGTGPVRAQVTQIGHRLPGEAFEGDKGIAAIDQAPGIEAYVLHPALSRQMRFRLGGELVPDPYEQLRATGAFIVVDSATNDTVGAGMVC